MEPVAAASAPKPGSGRRLDEPGRVLARSHVPSERRAAHRPFRRRVHDVTSRLRRLIAASGSPPLARTGSAEWLLDNRHLILEAAALVRQDLDRGFVRSLGTLVGDDPASRTRISAIAHALVAEGAGRVDPDRAAGFLEAYQSVTPLSTAELWAFPATLRFALLEEVVECGERILAGVDEADGTDPARGAASMGPLDERIAGAIGSLRTAATLDWNAFFEAVSRVDRTLRRLDPAGVYARMDFETRDRYRKAVEALALRSGQSEPGVALRAVGLAQGAPRDHPVRSDAGYPAAEPGGLAPRDHVGYYLIDRGRLELEACLGVSATRRRRAVRWMRRHPLPLYLAALGALTLLAWWAIAVPVFDTGPAGWGAMVVLAASSIPATAVAVWVFNWLAAQFVKPRTLPKMDFDRGLPESVRAAVVVPCILTDPDEARAVLRQLELNFGGNRDPGLRYVLLTDHFDAPRETMPGDDALLRVVVEGLEELNRRYGDDEPPPFVLLHRPRRWNASEDRWMGWERKRGKLLRLNELILGGDDSDFTCPVGDASALSGTRYIITLDADTFLPQGAAKRLVATLEHPLNAPHLAEAGTVTRGYTVLQPRVETFPESAVPTLFSRVYEADRGLDLYSHAVSDVYQDLFRRGIFAGKGIYHVEAFHRTLEGRAPENALLSHDLFEGVHGRAGLVTDVAVFEDFPTSVLTYMRRHHRWVRGDWQIAPWLLSRVPAEGGGRTRNPISALGRWQISDNLRRSLLTGFLMALLLATWLAPGDRWWWGTVAVGLVLGMPVMLGAATSTARGRLPRRTTVLLRPGPLGLFRWGLDVVFLPYRAAVEADAIARSLYRLLVSRRRLLEWTAASVTSRTLGGRQRVGAFARRLVPAPAAAGLGGLLVWALEPTRLPLIAPVLAAWLLAPLAAFWISRPRARRRDGIPPDVPNDQRELARRTWAYFETFLTPDHHWLPPDNYQEEPGAEVAPRTSPTNIGLGLLSTLAAYDLGYLTSADLLATLSNTLETVERLETHRGHLLNWYDTRTLDPLTPRYVSTVDSGNLAACLIALRAGLAEVVDHRFPRPQWPRGLADTLRALRTAVDKLSEDDADGPAGLTSTVEETLAGIESPHARPRDAARSVEAALPRLEEELDRIVGAGDGRHEAARIREVQEWLEALRGQVGRVLEEIEELRPTGTRPEAVGPPIGSGSTPLSELTSDGAVRRRDDIRELREQCSRLVQAMGFGFLYDGSRKLFHIGYSVSAGELDSSFYDLLASEARLASFVAIAKGDVPSEHWLHLGRPFGRAGRRAVLLSWAGTMFEYLMPRLLMRMPAHSLLAVSCVGAVEQQIAFARRWRVPWGVSESGYHELDDHGSYQYRAFGIPALGLHRSVGDRLVVSPYASVLAWPIDPRSVAENLDEVRKMGGQGHYGLYEAIDFGAPGDGGGARRGRIVRSYMAHHQGMILVALDNLLHDDAMPARFHAAPETAATEFLLHERAPGHVRTRSVPPPVPTPAREVVGPPATESWVATNDGPVPDAVVLSNGRLSSLVTATGAGGLRWGDHAVTRWHPDLTMDPWGHRLYVQDLASDEVWSPLAATGRSVDPGEVVFAPHKVEFHRSHGGISSRVAVAVAPGADVEIRRVTLINERPVPRRVHLTNYAEISLAPPREDARHPAFAKLFVQTEFRADSEALVFRRRPSSATDTPLVAAHAVSITSGVGDLVAWETDRERFLGRNGDVRRPAALRHRQKAGPGRSGCVLDPILSMTVALDLPPQGDVELVYLTSVGDTLETALSAIATHRTAEGVAWAMQRANARSQTLLHSLEIAPSAVRDHQRLLSALLHPYHELRGRPGDLPDRMPEQRALWGLGISGDIPLVAVRVSSPEEAGLLLDVLKAYALWREQNVGIEVAVLDEGPDGYLQPLADWLRRALARLGRPGDLNRPRGVHHLPATRLDPLHRATVEEAARVVLSADHGPLRDHLARLDQRLREPPPFVPVPTAAWSPQPTRPLPHPDPLLLHNGLGGFTQDGREYRIRLDPGTSTPAPWINVVATPELGFTVSEAGAGFSWVGNSGESRLTTWTNDPVLDRSGEVIYIRDEETAEYWTPTPRPRPGAGDYEVRHGAGYSEFRHHGQGLRHRLRLYAAHAPRAKVVELELENEWSRDRRLTVTYFAEWVLGADRQASAPHLETSFEATDELLLARDLFSELEEAGVAFLASDRPTHGWTTDRREFVGPGGCLVDPAALGRIGLGMRAGLGVEPCAALQIHLSLAAGESCSVRFFLGWGKSVEEIQEVVRACRVAGAGESMMAEVEDSWDGILSAITVRTPDPAADVMLNRWLLYQALSCRLWGRSGLYQSSGAFGFRDQLQDALAFRFVKPEVTRAQILEAARCQFLEGDVLHWWHPPSGRGVRTRCSDDLLWLPYVTADYVAASGDAAILDETVPYLTAPPLAPGERDRFGSFVHGPARGTLYEHCLRAIDRGSTQGRHGLPLMGTGDWNDALDRVGEGGRGESVWLAWFLLATLESFAGVADRRDDPGTAGRLRGRAEELRARVDDFAWDGEWYMRATYDDGAPVGSRESEEGRIDAISQAWGVLSGGAPESRGRQAMESVWRELVEEDDGLIRLLAPPFDRTPRWPGYIKAYPPGVRENGGQYTHAAIWAAWAFAKLGDGDRAWRCFEFLNPALKAKEWSDAVRYRVEPYVVAADVYSEPPHVGRGGWTWYTGSASWLWRLGVEAVLGLRPMAGGLEIDPCIPSHWPGYQATVRRGASEYRIVVDNPEGVCRGVVNVEVDGETVPEARIHLDDDGEVHVVRVSLGSRDGEAT